MHEHEQWLSIAKEDLAAAKFLLKGEFFAPVVYHTQQAAEKSLKAFLVFKSRSIIKTHDLIKLLELCMTIDSDFQKQFDAANFINPFSTKFRYPDEFSIFHLQEAKLAIKHAQSIMTLVVKKISKHDDGIQGNLFEE